MHKAIIHTAVLAALATLTAGCGPFDNHSSPPPTTTIRDPDKIAVFDPCTQIPDQVLTSQGLDPATKEVVTNAAYGPTTWRVCNWTPVKGGYVVALFSTSHTLDETRNNDTFTDFGDVTVDGRAGLTFHRKTDPSDNCNVAFAAQQGMFEVSADWLAGNKNPIGDLCALARQHASAFEPALPK